MENFPEEAIKTNVSGTRLLAEISVKFGAETFVNISTDKAINPTSVMGASKRIGEEVLRSLPDKGNVRFISVRFGNVLGSRGSVIPLFEEQIRKGGPVTVTSPEMKRYFMATSEAVLLVLQAAAAGIGGDIFLLDMGEPVRIDDLAREMIRLSGHQPDIDIPIVYTGPRPGEKLFEELLGAKENSEPTDHPKIFRVKQNGVGDTKDFWDGLRKLEALSRGRNSREEIVGLIQKIVPVYRPERSGTRDCLRW
jgi:FlaA1/EpsC-like NDP-sugar epimerase